MEVGFIGLGRMGRAMARNIAQAGHRVRAWNRSSGAVIEGVEMVGSPRDAFEADAVLTMLSDDAAIREVLLSPGVLRDVRPGLVHVVTSTVSVDLARELSQAHEAAGVLYVAAPVFGRPEVAEAAQLTVMAAGNRAAIEKVRPLLDVIGGKTWVLGDDPKQANAAKIAGNMMIAMTIEALAEAVTLTESNGLARQAFFELIGQTLFAGRSFETYSKKIAQDDYEPEFRMRLGLKDLDLATAAGAASGHELPMLRAVRTRMSEAIEAGLGDRDWSGMAGYTIDRER